MQYNTSGNKYGTKTSRSMGDRYQARPVSASKSRAAELARQLAPCPEILHERRTFTVPAAPNIAEWFL